MSKQKYERIKDIEFNHFQLDSPVEIIKGALLLDNQNHRVLLQLKLLNVSNSKISSVYISVKSYDDANDQILENGTVEQTYLDLNANPKESFGDKNPIILDKTVRNIKAQIIKVVFTSGEVWRNENNEYFQKPKQELLRNIDGSLLTYLKQKANNEGYNFAVMKYFPEMIDNMWICACGRPNKASNNECVRCGMNKKFIFTYTNENILRNDYSIHVARLAQETEEENRRKLEIEKVKIIKEQKEANELFEKEKEIANLKKRRRIKAIKISSFLISLMVISSMLYYLVIEPNDIYNKGILSVESGEYDEGISILNEVGDYKQAKSWIKEANYRKAIELLENNKYVDAIIIFQDLLEYKNSNILIEESKYRQAIDNYNEKKYIEAIEILTEIQNHPKVEEALNEVKYEYAKQLIVAKKFSESLSILNNIEKYRDVNSKLIPMLNYKWYQALLEDKKFTDAWQKLSVIDELLYPEARSEYYAATDKHNLELKDKSYNEAIKSASSGDYENAFRMMENLGDYKDSKNLASEYKKEAYKWIFTGGMTQSTYSRFEDFSFYGKLTGGPPGGKIDLQYTWKTPDWTFSDTSRGWEEGFFWETGEGPNAFNTEPAYASRGVGSVTIKVKSTGEILAKYTFNIY